MTKKRLRDVKGVIRKVNAFDKKPNKYGNYLVKETFYLKRIDIGQLRKWFKIDPKDPDRITRDLIHEPDITPEIAKMLEPYLISGKFEFEKYDYCFDSEIEEGYEEYWTKPHADEYEDK